MLVGPGLSGRLHGSSSAADQAAQDAARFNIS
jgi:hypothetical protein